MNRTTLLPGALVLALAGCGFGAGGGGGGGGGGGTFVPIVAPPVGPPAPGGSVSYAPALVTPAGAEDAIPVASAPVSCAEATAWPKT